MALFETYNRRGTANSGKAREREEEWERRKGGGG